jgi:DNA invertase Pin-like site-specific DNA recombinase
MKSVQKTCCKVGASNNAPVLRAETDDLLAAEPAALTGALIGYARVSTRDQKLDRQFAALGAAGCIRVFADKKSGKNAEREELGKALDYVRPGDILVVESLDRLGRSLQDLITIVSALRKQGVGLRSLKEAIDTTTPGGRLVFHVFAALAEFIRELIVEGTLVGLDAARARGQRLGRPPAMTPEQVGHARAMLAQPKASIASIARLLGVSRSTLYKYVPELKPGGDLQLPRPARGRHRAGRHPRMTKRERELIAKIYGHLNTMGSLTPANPAHVRAVSINLRTSTRMAKAPDGAAPHGGRRVPGC